MGRPRTTLALLLVLAATACSDGHNLAGDSADGDLDDRTAEDGRDVPPEDADADADLPDGAEAESGADADADVGADADADADADVPDVTIVFPPAACGDGTVDPGEECDDRNRMNGDGCDWQCRIGDGSFDYEPLDPSVPAIASAGSVVRVPASGETTLWALYDGCPFCGALHLAWTGTFFGLAYAVDQPYFGVHVHFLNRYGAETHDMWQHDTPWQIWNHALAWSGTGLALFSGTAFDGIALSRFDGDGIAVEEFVPIRGPDPRDPTEEVVQYLSTAAWSADRYLVVSPWSDAIWALETFGPAGEAVDSIRLNSGREARGCVYALPIPGGWAVTNGWQLAILDRSLVVTGYSGQIGAARPESTSEPLTGARVVDVGDGLVLVWMAGFASGGAFLWNLWMAGLDYSGELTWPPRPVVVGIQPVQDAELYPGGGGGRGWSGWSTAYGPAGIVVVAWVERDGGTVPGGELRALNTDRWGNVVSGPISVLEEGETTLYGWALDVAASDTGYGIVTVEDGPMPTTGYVVFRPFEPAP